MQGKFIVFEGPDGNVLREQAQRLYARLRERGIKVHLTREPSTGPIGGQIRQILDQRLDITDPQTIAAYFMADRSDHLHSENGILSHLANGEHVICVRYILSTYAFQGLNLDMEWLRALNQPFPVPDMTFYIDTPETPSVELRESYVKAYRILRDEGQPGIALNGRKSIDDLETQIDRFIDQIFKAE
jgi:dTMP kinase